MREKLKTHTCDGAPATTRRPRKVRLVTLFLFLRGFGKTGLADLLREERPVTAVAVAGAAGVAIPLDIDIIITSAFFIEPIRRVAVHVVPRARFGNGDRQTQKTTESRLRILVLVERLLCSTTEGQNRP